MSDDGALVQLRCSAVVFRGGSVLLLQRRRDHTRDWVLPGGSPRAREGAAACARREVAEETGLQVDISRVAFVLETSNQQARTHVVEIVFLAGLSDQRTQPQPREEGLTPVFQPVDALGQLDLRPPLGGHIRALHARGTLSTAAYLGNVWRPRPATDAD